MARERVLSVEIAMSGNKIDLDHLAQSWVHAHEEDTPTTSVYRPAQFPLPPARGRTGFQLHADGSLTARGPGPADQTVTAPGTWTLAGNRLELCPQGERAHNLEIESVEPDRLVVKNSPACPTD
jgi:hypothetical protein